MRLRLPRRSVPSFVLLLLITITTPAAVRRTTLFAQFDSYSWESQPEANNGGSNNFQITSSNWGTKNMRGWVQFNLSSIPVGSWVIAASLSLRIWAKSPENRKESLGDPTGRAYGIFRILEPWGEYRINWKNQPMVTNEGMTVSRVPSGAGGWDGPEVRMTWDVTTIAQFWAQGNPNYGVMVRDLEENSPVLYATQFFAHDQVPNESYYPRLEVLFPSIPFTLGLAVEVAALLVSAAIFVRNSRKTS